MVYVQGGKVVENRPWSLARLVEMFWGFITFLIFFFKTLVGLDPNQSGRNGARGGGGGGPSGGGGGGGGPKGNIRRITTIQDCSMPGGG